jgi:hypothetical protein
MGFVEMHRGHNAFQDEVRLTLQGEAYIDAVATDFQLRLGWADEAPDVTPTPQDQPATVMQDATVPSDPSEV